MNNGPTVKKKTQSDKKNLKEHEKWNLNSVQNTMHNQVSPNLSWPFDRLKNVDLFRETKRKSLLNY